MNLVNAENWLEIHQWKFYEILTIFIYIIWLLSYNYIIN